MIEPSEERLAIIHEGLAQITHKPFHLLTDADKARLRTLLELDRYEHNKVDPTFEYPKEPHYGPPVTRELISAFYRYITQVH